MHLKSLKHGTFQWTVDKSKLLFCRNVISWRKKLKADLATAKALPESAKQ